jgi:hypothetical protein
MEERSGETGHEAEKKRRRRGYEVFYLLEVSSGRVKLPRLLRPLHCQRQKEMHLRNITFRLEAGVMTLASLLPVYIYLLPLHEMALFKSGS